MLLFTDIPTIQKLKSMEDRQSWGTAWWGHNGIPSAQPDLEWDGQDTCWRTWPHAHFQFQMLSAATRFWILKCNIRLLHCLIRLEQFESHCSSDFIWSRFCSNLMRFVVSWPPGWHAPTPLGRNLLLRVFMGSIAKLLCGDLGMLGMQRPNMIWFIFDSICKMIGWLQQRRGTSTLAPQVWKTQKPSHTVTPRACCNEPRLPEWLTASEAWQEQDCNARKSNV